MRYIFCLIQNFIQVSSTELMVCTETLAFTRKVLKKCLPQPNSILLADLQFRTIPLNSPWNENQGKLRICIHLYNLKIKFFVSVTASAFFVHAKVLHLGVQCKGVDLLQHLDCM